MSKTAIINCHIITPERIIFDSAVVIKNDKIIDVDVHADWDKFDGVVIDGRGRYLSPGFIDIHTHGGGGHDFLDGTIEAFIKACELHAQYGTTSLLPTTLAGDDEELKNTFKVFREAQKVKNNGAQMLGLHLEGPYFAAEYKGAQDEKYLKNPTPGDYERIFEWSEGSIIRWSAAPELPGSERFGEFMQRNGIYGSIGHSAATYDQVLSAYENGFQMVTHLYSGMSSITRKRGFRIPGVVESVYLIEGMMAELIADGCHLPPALLKMAYKIKGAENLVLVTDSMRGAGMDQGESILGSLQNGQQVFIENGVAYMPDRTAFAGSVCTSNRLVRTMYQQVGVSLCDAVKMITVTPAKSIGIADKKGSISLGKDADLLLFDNDIDISLCMVQGEIIFEKGR